MSRMRPYVACEMAIWRWRLPTFNLAREVTLDPLPVGEASLQWLKWLNATTLELATSRPEQFFEETPSLNLDARSAHLLLEPYEIVRMTIKSLK